MDPANSFRSPTQAAPINAYQWRWWRQQGHTAINRDTWQRVRHGQRSPAILQQAVQLDINHIKQASNEYFLKKKRTRSSYNSTCHTSQTPTETVMRDFNVLCLCQDLGDMTLPQYGVGSAFITRICDKSNTSSSNSYSSSKNSLKKAYTYSLLQSRRRPKGKTSEGRTKQWYH